MNDSLVASVNRAIGAAASLTPKSAYSPVFAASRDIGLLLGQVQFKGVGSVALESFARLQGTTARFAMSDSLAASLAKLEGSTALAASLVAQEKLASLRGASFGALICGDSTFRRSTAAHLGLVTRSYEAVMGAAAASPADATDHWGLVTGGVSSPAPSPLTTTAMSKQSNQSQSPGHTRVRRSQRRSMTRVHRSMNCWFDSTRGSCHCFRALGSRCVAGMRIVRDTSRRLCGSCSRKSCTHSPLTTLWQVGVLTGTTSLGDDRPVVRVSCTSAVKLTSGRWSSTSRPRSPRPSRSSIPSRPGRTRSNQH